MSEPNAAVPVPVIQQNGLAVKTTIDFDLQSVVSVGVARAERKLRISIKEKTARLKELKTRKDALLNAIGKAAMDSAPDYFKEAAKKLEDVAKLLRLKDDVVLVKAIADTDARKNRFKVVMTVDTGGYSGPSQTTIATTKSVFTEAQIKDDNTIQDINVEMGEINNAIIDMRRKLSDFPALERQLRAHVIETEMNKTEDGKALLDAAMSKFEADLDLMG